MLVRDLRKSGSISFAQYVGDGNYKGHPFRLSVTTAPDGTLLGLPRFTFKGSPITVTFELSDLLPMAIKAAGIELDE